MAAHTALVVLGDRPALDRTAAPARASEAREHDAFVVPVVVLSGVMLCTLLALQACGGAAGAVFGVLRARQRFARCFSDLCFYSASVVSVARVCWGASWWWPSGWHELMADGGGPHTAPLELRFLHLAQTSYYLASCVLLLARPRKRDFAAMAAHHVITTTLLLLSYGMGYLRVAAVVVFLHDVFDPLLLLAKCAHYANIPVLPDVSFACAAAVFATTRLCLYPAVIYHAWLGVRVGGARSSPPAESGLILLLAALVPIHVFWFTLIVKVLKSVQSPSAVAADVRSDSEDEDEPGPTSAPLRARARKRQKPPPGHAPR